MADGEFDSLPDLALWREAASVSDGELLAGRVGDERVIVWRGGGRLKAYTGTCPHLSGPLDKGIVANGQVRCPWHHACFDLSTGAAVAAPAFDDLAEHSLEIEGERFRVQSAKAPPAKPAVKGNASSEAMAIVGGGAAGFAAADALRRLGWRGGIAMHSAEDEAPYDRTLLTKDYLEGRFGDDRLPIAARSLADLGVDFHGGAEVRAIDPVRKQLRLADGSEATYTKLLLATGAAPRPPDFAGAELPHVMTLRSLRDCRRILAKIEPDAHVAVVGGSFIALEAAASLRARGLAVEVIAPESRPLEKVFGPELSDLVMKAHSDNGVRFHLMSKIARVELDRIHLESGRQLRADMVIVGIGVQPRLDLAQSAGLAIDDGVVVDSCLRTSDPHIFAAGDIACWPDVHSGEKIRVEHWVVAERQGQTAARNMLGRDEPFTAPPFFWTKHFDLSIRYVGHAVHWDETIVEGDLGGRNARVSFRRGGRELAVATVERDEEALRAELAMEAKVEPRNGSFVGPRE